MSEWGVYLKGSGGVQTGVAKAGYMYKRGEINSAYKKRYFEVILGELAYFGERGEKMKGLIALKGATLNAKPEDNEENGMQVELKDKSRIYYLQTEDAKSFKEWSAAIAKCIVGGKVLLGATLEDTKTSKLNDSIEVDESRRRSTAASSFAVD
uniref:PH domain-containing protein n=1 Tax=Lotharella oceanica TaxID=641309 RepID=A0A7S2TXA9_9EUKA|mmetsp:Transcript_34094/g.63219  ORF Transcript_34094/g.63219 Transcript_34094/m.63219 type:complete len:153 (+) Transcript_34094:195-653(+)